MPSDEPTVVIIDFGFDSHAGAEAFHRRLEQLWAGAGANHGVRGLRAGILDVAESVDY